MKIIGVPILFAIILVVGSFITAFFQHPEASASAASLVSTQSRNRKFHFVQECSEYKETPGSFCTIASSDLAAVPTPELPLMLDVPLHVAVTGVVPAGSTAFCQMVAADGKLRRWAKHIS